MASVFKAIKPSKLKIDDYRLELVTALHQAERGMKQDFNATVNTWDHAVKFESLITLTPNPEVLVWTDDKIYGYVNNGTKQHPIDATNTKSLRFNWDDYGSYGPKTTPGVIGSVNARLPQTEVQFVSVSHLGTEARHFDRDIQLEWAPKFKKACEQAMRNASKKSGHGK